MKKKIIKLSLIIVSAFTIISCGNNSDSTKDSAETTENNDELKGFMVGGMYFMNGFGGVSAVEGMVTQNGTDKENLIKSYEELFILPFKPEQATEIKNTLKEWWDINNKEELMVSLEDLKTKKDLKNPHKAWDYARLVNNACMGYAAGYLTDIEAKKYIADNLILVQKDFSNWSDFLKDYNVGRKTWDPESQDMKAFDEVVADMTKNKDGLYQLIPLK